MSHAFSNIDPTLTVIHVGGRGGGFGETDVLLQLGKDLSLSIFEANIESEDITWDNYDRLIKEYATRYGIKLSVIPQCLSSTIGKKKFHINVMPDCSSLLEMSPDAKNYQRMNSPYYRIVWGQICQPKRLIDIDVTTIDEVYRNNVIQMPHFISIDAQGAEYDILQGASEALRGDLLGVISEVEFRELYDGQKLFTDQFALLRKHEFDLFDLYNTEYWHPSLIIGKGTLMVAEALFLRNFRYFVKRDRNPTVLLSNLSKLATVAYYFERRSYAFEITEYIMDNWQHEWDALVQRSDSKYMNDLKEFYSGVKSHQSKLEKVPTYSDFLARYLSLGGETPGTVWTRRIRKFLPSPICRLVRFYLTKIKRLIEIILILLR